MSAGKNFYSQLPDQQKYFDGEWRIFTFSCSCLLAWRWAHIPLTLNERGLSRAGRDGWREGEREERGRERGEKRRERES